VKKAARGKENLLAVRRFLLFGQSRFREFLSHL
jgi:hypothetical protein